MGLKTPSTLVGVVVRAGTMDKVVKVQRAKQMWDNYLQKVRRPRTASAPSPFRSSSIPKPPSPCPHH